VTESDKKTGAAASDKNSTSQHDGGGGGGGGGGGYKDSDATFVVGGAEGTTPAATVSIGKQMIEALERGNRALEQQLEAQRSSLRADREHRAALLGVLDRLAGAVARIADKL
jgi:hypothetical protein